MSDKADQVGKSMRYPFLSDYTTLVGEFMVDKNFPLTVSDLRSGSGKKVWWVCGKGHEWVTSVSHRCLNGSGCPYCAKRKVLSGFNDLGTLYPDVAAEWDYSSPLNKGLTPEQILAGTGVKLGFVCPLGHKYETNLRSRVAGAGCNVCHGLVVLPGFNDLASASPGVAVEWDYDSPVNEGLVPSGVSNKTRRQVGWVCVKGHKFVQVVADRTRKDSRRSGCPYCSNRSVLAGFNDLGTLFPDVAAEWDYSSPLNEGLTPSEVVAGGRRVVGWVCAKGHVWEAKLANRCQQGQGCGKCALNHTSKVESDFRELFKNYFSVVSDGGVKVLFSVPGEGKDWAVVDILGLYGEGKVIVEHDGAYWHQGKEDVDVRKTLRLLAEGFFVVRIREQYRHLALEFLPVEDKRLFQVTFDSYRFTVGRQQVVVDEVLGWLRAVGV